MASLPSVFSLTGQVALITGGSRGIGRSIAKVFGEAGAKVVIVARDSSRLADAAHQLQNGGLEVFELTADISDAGQASKVVIDVLAKYGQIDVLVNNAGVLQAGPITDFAAPDWDRMIAVNLNSAFYLCRSLAPAMMERRAGRIINISSITAETGGVSGSVQYSASKGGLLSFTKTLARDLAPYNITVNAICPGQIETDMGTLSGDARRRVIDMIPLKRFGTPDDIAYCALFLASNAASYITGATIDVNGGVLKR